MTPYEKYEHWAVISDYDIDTAESLIQCERWAYVAMLCQQGVERLIKGMLVCHTAKEAPKSHNLPFLFNRLAENEIFLKTEEGRAFHDGLPGYENLLIDLMFYYMSDYPFSYKKVNDRFIAEDKAKELFKQTLELIKWMKQFQKVPV